MSKDPVIDRVSACLYGGAIGDAIGAPVEKRPTSVAREYVERLEKSRWTYLDGVVNSLDNPRFDKFGQVTDDTQLTVLLAESILDRGKLDVVDFSARLVSSFDDGLIVGFGGNTKRAVQRLGSGIGWFESGGTSSSNGSCMRAAPIGLWHGIAALKQEEDYDVGKVLRDGVIQSMGTHLHDDSVAASAGMAYATYLAFLYGVGGEEIDAHEFAREVQSLLRSTHDYEHDDESGYPLLSKPSSDLLYNLGPFAYRGVEYGENANDKDVLEVVVNAYQDKRRGWEGITPSARASFIWALYSFLRHPNDYRSAVSLAVWPGGDVDSTASMAGQLVGAYNGKACLPYGPLFGLTAEGLGQKGDLNRVVGKFEQRWLET